MHIRRLILTIALALAAFGNLHAQVPDSLRNSFIDQPDWIQDSTDTTATDTGLLIWEGANADSLAQDSSDVAIPTSTVTDRMPSESIDSVTARASAKSIAIEDVSVYGIPQRKLNRKLRRLYDAAQDSTDFVRLDSLALLQVHAAGYPAAQIRSRTLVNEALAVRVQPGRFYYYDSIGIRNLNREFADEAKLFAQTESQEPFSFQDFNQRLRYVLQQYEAAGYPFVKLQDLAVQYVRRGDSIGVQLFGQLSAGNLMVVDSVDVRGDIRESPRFVRNLIGIQKNDVYDQKRIDRIQRTLNNTIYFRNTEPPIVRFYDEAVTIEVNTERRKSNRFDALVGLLPPREGQQKFDFTGLADLHLVSPFRMGEVISLKWEKLQTSSQQLDVRYMQPFLFGTNFNAELQFHLLKQDTSFLRRNFQPTGYYRFNEQISVKFFYRNAVTSLLSPDQYAEVTWPPPPILDTQTNSGGVGVLYNTLDYRPNPTRGFDLELDIVYGQKVISKTQGLDSLEFDRLIPRQPRTEIDFDGRLYIPTSPRLVLAFRNQTYWLQLKEYLDNDQKFVGGARSLRGFNENQFLASFYSIMSAEYRLLLDRDSYIGLFVDAAMLDYRNFESRERLFPYGFGLALSFRTPAGVMSVSYALGSAGDVPIQPTRGRVHLGLVNTF